MAVVVALAATAFTAGCGGDDESPSPATTAEETSSQASADETAQEGGADSNGGQSDAPNEASGAKAEFLREGNNVCRKAVAKIQLAGKKVFNELGQNAKAFQDTLVNKVLIPNFEAEVRGLRQLDPPPGDEAEINAIIGEIEDVIAGLENNPKQDDYYPYVKAERLADQYGLDTCGAPALQ